MIDIFFMCGEDFEQDVRPVIQSFTKESPSEVVHTGSIAEAKKMLAEKEVRGNTEKPDNVLMLEVKDGRIAVELRYSSGQPSFSEKYASAGQEASVGSVLQSEHTTPAGPESWSEEDTYSPDTEHKPLRNRVLTVCYHVFSKAFGKKLPWGILTGIRPTKLCLTGLLEGKEEELIVRELKDEYLVSDEKAALGMEIAKREKQLLSGIDLKNTYSIYLGIPFCPSICNYCSFSSYPFGRYGKLAEDYVKALSKEIEAASGLFPKKTPATVYFGGGTPTTLNTEQLRFLIRKVKNCFSQENVTEFTVEAGRADTITYEKLQMLKEEGITRISVNPQSMRAKTLEVIGRKHTPEQVEEAFAMARRAGHDNINMDIILGLTQETPEDVAYTLSKIKELSPDSLTVHMLARKRAARLTTERDSFLGMDAENVPEQFRLSREFTKANGYLPYYLYRQKYMAENMENIGYSREGKECLYNVLIMEEQQIILALGAGASSKFVFEGENRFERVENVKSVTDYIERVDEMIERKVEFIKNNIILSK